MLDWPIDTDAKDDREGLLASVKRVHAVVDELVAGGTVVSEKIVIGGFSQGGALALLATYLYPKKLGGCVCLSGWLTIQDTFSAAVKAADSKNAKTPCFWGHGMMDPVGGWVGGWVGSVGACVREWGGAGENTRARNTFARVHAIGPGDARILLVSRSLAFATVCITLLRVLWHAITLLPYCRFPIEHQRRQNRSCCRSIPRWVAKSCAIWASPWTSICTPFSTRRTQVRIAI